MKKFLLKSIRPSQFVLIGDQVLIVLGLISAIIVNFRLLSEKVFPIHTTIYNATIHLFLGIGAWVLFRVYKKVIRFFTSKDFLNLASILLLVHVVTYILSMLIFRILLIPKYQLKLEVFIISFFITSSYIIGSRLIISYLYFYYNRSQKVKSQKKILIYGAGELGVFLKKSILTHYNGEYKLVGFLDDDPQKIGRLIGGIQVLNASKNIEEFIRSQGITDVIIANKTITPERKSTFLESMLPLNIKIREISSIQSFFNANFNLEKLASIDINDLMNRKPIQLFDDHVALAIKNKIILVTGAAGSIGSEIVRKLSEHGASQIICVDFSESALYDLEQELSRKHNAVKYHFLVTDIRDEELVENVFKTYHPDFIYHAAAYKHVPLMEKFPWEAARINVFATESIVKIAIKYGSEKFVFVSSDKAVNPTSVMGATKRLAEIIVKSYASSSSSTCFAITRFGNVLGSNGSVVPLFKKQIQEGGPVTVTHPDMVRYFMTIPEACQLVLEASVMAKGGEVFVFDMGEPVKVVDLAKNMIRLAGYLPDIDIKIEFIGQRPGEKLYEEVFYINESMKTTHNQKILISNEVDFTISDADKIIQELKDINSYYNADIYRNVLTQLLPEYQHIAISGIFSNFNTKNKTPDYKFQN